MPPSLPFLMGGRAAETSSPRIYHHSAQASGAPLSGNYSAESRKNSSSPEGESNGAVNFHVLKLPAFLAKEAVPVHSTSNRHGFQRRVFITALWTFLPVSDRGAIVANYHCSA